MTHPKLLLLPLVLLLGTPFRTAHADPGYYVVTPYPDEGLRTVELRYWTVARTGRPEVVWPELGLSYGVNTRWTTGLLLSWIGSSQMATRLSTVSWSNDILLTQGNWPIDLALHTLWNADQVDHGSGSFEFGPALQTDLGRTQLNLNAFFERGTGQASGQPTTMKYQWQVRHRWLPQWHVGLQGFGELGPWDHWDPHSQQSNRAGPALFSRIRLSQQESLQFSAAWLAGRTYRRSGHMLSLRAAVTF